MIYRLTYVDFLTNFALGCVNSVVGACAGAYLGRGPLGHGPPLWVARIAKLHRKVSKIEAWPPLCKLGIRLWARNHLISGEKWDEI